MVALYDEQEIMERYVTNKVNAAVRDAETEKARRIARNLISLGTVSYDDIEKVTGLPVSEVEKMAELS